MAEAVVEGLEVVQVDEQDGDLGRAGGERLLHAVDEEGSVREIGERIVEGLVVELLLELAKLVDRLLEPVVLERDACVVGERLEQIQVLLAERADHAEAVCEHDRADHAVLAGKHREHRVRHEAAVEVAPKRLRAERPLEPHCGAVSVDEVAQFVRDLVVDRLHHLAVVARPQGRAERRTAVGAEQHDLGELGAERVERLPEQALQGLNDLRRARERARRLVEELEALVALALEKVGAVGEEDRDRGHEQQGDRPRVGRDDDRPREGEARVGGAHDEVHHEHLAERSQVERRPRTGRSRGRSAAR